MLGRLFLIDAQARIIAGGCCRPGMHAWSDDLSRRPPESQTLSRCPDVATDVSSSPPSQGHSSPLHGWALEENVVLTILPTCSALGWAHLGTELNWHDGQTARAETREVSS